ncbi:electron transfer flavoprotein-ubiquinone oxidoreductase [Photobacterium sp. 1_MG-2023]|uniref:electron transfer flavoprotein-ubiquinone oxidoreductase n=1 Tax=Photobacterium sp. 1_MG-2023 TaxID=3062646 RepID=UPI0026E3A011|nr:electron transfer flavoprotein-ubiquinone oxidoreductase [Photobacterium sp. 1_MG-2023]MDO6707000.1 electron transfer flavoprotein-ubiquinone oxidoreductase [Photobacterium sp. 1_MG-2023]
MERESMAFDVVIVGAGPAGLASACKLMQLAAEHQQEISVCVIEKGAEVGSHILSGALFEPRALDELFPDWSERGAPLNTAVSDDQFYWLTNEYNQIKMPAAFVPAPLHNQGNYIISLGELCRWLAQQAEALGVAIFPGFAAAELYFNEQQAVAGVITTDMGRDKQGQEKQGFQPGIILEAKYTIFAEGARGHLGKALIEYFKLDENKQPQHYAIGFKELWQVPAQQHQPGLVLHSTGWPLSQTGTSGGGFLYHFGENLVSVGLVIDLNYSHPYLSPFDEFQQMKHHPRFASILQGGERIAYGARVITKGGYHSLPQQSFPGGLLVGCDAGTLNGAKIKGSHTAMKSGMLAAEAIFEALTAGHAHSIPDYQARFQASWLQEELYQARNFGAAIHKFGSVLGGALATLEFNVLKKPLWSVKDHQPDHLQLKTIDQVKPLNYPKPDGQLSFDRASSVFLSTIKHEENQPCHLQLKDAQIPTSTHLSLYDEPSQRYCPAGVYEIVQKKDGPFFQINAGNCIHCKTCDIKDPSQNIQWTPPEGGSGPNYSSM